MKILVPTDFSQDAYNALHFATQLYGEKECDFHIIHVCDRMSHFRREYAVYQGNKSLKQFLSDRVDECLLETRHRIIGDTAKNPLHRFTVIKIHDTFTRGIKVYLRHFQADLLVMGNKGRTGAKEIFFGGNTIKMVKSSIPCPLLCIPKEREFKSISALAYISDYRHSLPANTMEIISSIAGINKAIVHVLHVGNGETSQQKSKKAALAAKFGKLSLEFHQLTGDKAKAKSIAAFVEKHPIDLLTMAYYPHYLLTKLFREPVVMDLSIYLEIPLLILPGMD